LKTLLIPCLRKNWLLIHLEEIRYYINKIDKEIYMHSIKKIGIPSKDEITLTYEDTISLFVSDGNDE